LVIGHFSFVISPKNAKCSRVQRAHDIINGKSPLTMTNDNISRARPVVRDEKPSQTTLTVAIAADPYNWDECSPAAPSGQKVL
jgi:hypothetical protein